MSVRDTDMSVQDTEQRKKWLLYYVLTVATLAFTGRAIPLGFLPLVLKEQFGQSDSAIGIVMAIYPLAALLTTPLASRVCRGTSRIVFLHSWAIILIACAMFVTSLSTSIKELFGNQAGAAWIMLSRFLQGVGASFYLSSNTCLITRELSHKVAYVVAMTEVAVGSGSQLGRMCGGFLYDLGGFACPFYLIAILQAASGVLGFFFIESSPPAAAESGLTEGTTVKEAVEVPKIPWRTLFTPRLLLGALGAGVPYFVGCFGDATLLQYLQVHLAPTTMGAMSLALSSRGATYLIASFAIGQLMHGDLVSYEGFLAFGGIAGSVGVLMLAPQPFIFYLETWLTGRSTPSHAVLWGMQIAAFVTSSAAGACMFVPSLPLMQSEVKSHGDHAVEQVASVFVIMMTSAEMLGPIFGGWIVGLLGFAPGTLILSLVPLPVFILSMLTYDRAVTLRRRRSVSLLDSFESADAMCVSHCGPIVPTDGEATFAWRRLPFAIDAKRAGEGQVPMSAPSSVFRRLYSHNKNNVVPMTAPSENFRRPYVKSSGRH